MGWDGGLFPALQGIVGPQPAGRPARRCLTPLAMLRCRPLRRRKEPLPALRTPPSDYLASVGRSVAALHCAPASAPPPGHPPAESSDAAAEAAAGVRRALQDEREVAAQLTPCAADPGACRLHLRVLAPARTQAALAAKLGPQAAHRQARLRHRLQGGEVHRAVCAALRFSERAALHAPLLAAQRCSPKPNALVALARVLRDGAPLAAGVAAERAAAEQRRRQLGAGVLGQHKEMKKAWREKR